MRVAVVSAKNQQVGKTALSLMLTNAYPNAVGRESVYVTNGSLNEILQLETFSKNSVSIENSINVLTALSSTDNLTKEDILDYAYRPTNTNAMLFDIYSKTVGEDEAHDNFMSVVEKLGSRFIVMDLNGGVNDSSVKRLMDECDVILYVFRPIKEDCDAAKEYIESLDPDEKLKVKLLCNMWDSTGIKKKTVQEYMKIRGNSMLWFPYHPNIQRTMFEGRLCILNRLMIEGRDQCLALRQPIKDILSFLCDTTSLKVVQDITKWKI